MIFKMLNNIFGFFVPIVKKTTDNFKNSLLLVLTISFLLETTLEKSSVYNRYHRD